MKATAAAITACAMTFALSACGSDQETSAGGLSTAATAPGAADAAGDQTVVDAPEADDAAEGDKADAPAGNDKAKKDGEKSGGDKKRDGNNNSGDAAVPTIANPFGDGEIEARTYEPIADGQAGSEADRREMEDVVRAVTNPDSFATWTRTILDNSCAAVREPALEEFERQGLTLDMVEQIMAAQGESLDMPKTDVTVSDVRVNGNRASATVTTSNSGGEATQVQLFAKEGGKWKVCTND